MGGGEDVGIKKRKVVWDDYCRGFYAESRVEAVQRLCDYRAKLTDVVNKNEATRCQNKIRQVNAERQMFLLKRARDALKHNETWQDHKAHLSVLDKLAKEREPTFIAETDNYGRYPPEYARRIDLDDMVADTLREMSPIVQRRREAAKLLGKRNGINLIDRTRTTEDIFEDMKKRKSRVSSPAKSPVPARKSKSMPKLILPAITVKMTKARDKSQTVEPVSQNRDKEKIDKTEKGDNLPSVFVTQF